MHFAFSAERHSAADAPKKLIFTSSHCPPPPEAISHVSKKIDHPTKSDEAYSVTDGPAARPFALTDSSHYYQEQEASPAVSRTPGVMPPPHFRASPYPQGVPLPRRLNEATLLPSIRLPASPSRTDVAHYEQMRNHPKSSSKPDQVHLFHEKNTYEQVLGRQGEQEAEKQRKDAGSINQMRDQREQAGRPTKQILLTKKNTMHQVS
jgi:hypothetical protein